MFNINSFCKFLKSDLSFDFSLQAESLSNESGKVLVSLEKVLFKFKLINLSFLILKKQLKETASCYAFFEKERKVLLINKYLFDLKKIEQSLKLKLKEMHLSEIEQKFVLNN